MIGKRTLGAVLFALLMLVATFPVSAQVPSQSVQVGIYQNEPLVFRNADGQPAGFYVDILEAVAEAEGWELQFVDCDFPDCLALLEEGELDLMTDIAYSEARAQRFDFNQETVLSNWGRVYARSDDIQSLLDLRDRTVAVVREDIYYTGLQTLLQSLDVPCHFLELDDYAPVLDAVERGQADAGLVSRLYGLRHAGNYDVIRTPILCCPVSLRFAALKGQNEALLRALDQHLQEMKAESGSHYYQSLDRWFAGAVESPSLLERIPPWVTQAVLALAALAVLGVGGSFLLRAQLRARTAELRASERRYRELFEHVPIGLYRSTPDGQLLDANPALVAMLGYPDRETLLQTPVEALYADPAARAEALRTIERSEGGQELIVQLRRRDGTHIWAREHALAITDEGGRIIRYEGTLEDITPQIQLQRTLEAQAALASLSLQGLGQRDFAAISRPSSRRPWRS